MIKADNIGELMVQNKANNLRIFDLNKNRILDIKEDTPEAAFQKFEHYIPILSAYKNIIVKGGDNAKEAQSFTNANEWRVYFEASNTSNQMAAIPMPQNIESKEYAELKMAFELYKKDVEFEKRFKTLEEKLESKNKSVFPSVPKEYFPFIGKLFKMSNEDIRNLMGISEPTTILSGPNDDDELNEELESLFGSIATKVSGKKMLILLRAINQNPSLVDMAIGFINQGGMAGPPDEFIDYQDVRSITTFDSYDEDEY